MNYPFWPGHICKCISENIFSQSKLAGEAWVSAICVCVLCRDSCLPKETVKVHSQYHRNPPAGLATKERRCPGRKIKRGRCGESLKEGAKRKREEKRKYARKRESGEGVWIHILPILPQALQRLRLAYNTSGNESESWRVPPALLSPQSPPNPFCWFLFFFPLSSSLSAPISLSLSSLRLLAHKTWQLLSSWPQFHSFCLKYNSSPSFFIMHILPLIYFKCMNNISHTNNTKHETTKPNWDSVLQRCESFRNHLHTGCLNTRLSGARDIGGSRLFL